MSLKYFPELLLVCVVCCIGYGIVAIVHPWREVWQERAWIEQQAAHAGWADYRDYEQAKGTR